MKSVMKNNRYPTISLRSVRTICGVLFLLPLALALPAPEAKAAIFTVTNTADDGTDSLRQAIAAANDNGETDRINFDIPNCNQANPCTIDLSSGQIVISDSVTIQGTGANVLTIRNTAEISPTSRVFSVGNNAVTLNGLTITGGNVSDGFGGGGVSIDINGTVNFNNCVITGNRAGYGGAVAGNSNAAYMTLTGSTISNNTVSGTSGGSGGGIDSIGVITLINSTVSGNSNLSNNRANGGGIWSSNSLTITNSTITNNSVGGTGAGLRGAGGVYNGGGARVRNSIIAANVGNSNVPDVRGAFISNGYNLIGNVGAATGFTQTGDQTGSVNFSARIAVAPAAVLNPQMGPLTNNGGTVPTHSLLSNSPAIDKGNSFGATTDARGLTRPVDSAAYPNATNGDGADIGAVELQAAPTAAHVSLSGRVLAANGRGLANAIVTLTDANGATRATRTTTHGGYRFEEVTAGQSYIITVQSKRFSFAPQIVSVGEEIGNLDFFALP